MPVTDIFPGLFVKTLHGVGVVANVRHDGIVVTKLTASTSCGGGAVYMGYFHPSSIEPLAAMPSLAVGAAFQPVSPAARGGFQRSNGMDVTGAEANVAPPPSKVSRTLEHPCSPPRNKRRRLSELVLHF